MVDRLSTDARRRLTLGTLGLLGAIVLFSLGWRLLAGDGPIATGPAGPAPWRRSDGSERVPVRIATAAREELAVRIKALGTVTPLNVVTVRSRVDGELFRIAFEEGQVVEAGQLLAEIDPRQYQVRLAQAEGQQQQNLAELANAEADLKRYQDLQAKGYVAAQQLGNQEALVRQYRARRQTDQATVDDARLQLDFTRITAPISGRTGLREVDVGNLVRASDAEGMVTITQVRPISVLFTVAEPELPAVRAAVRQSPSLVVEAWDREERQRLAVGTLLSLDNQIDTSTGTLRLRAHFDNADESLFPNQFVNVRLQVRNETAVVIPNVAVQYGATGSYVYVVDAEDTVELRSLQLGAADGERVAVLAGLEPGERVVLEGMDRLRGGSTVEIVPDAPDTT